jgi:hypothetical protein
MPPVPGLVGFSVEEVQGVPDIFGPEGIAECEVILQENIFFTDHKNNLEVAKLPDDRIVMEEGDVLAGHIEIDVLVAVPVEEVFEMFEANREVVAPAEADDFVEEEGVFEGEVGSVPGAEAASRGDDGGVGVLKLDKGEDFGQHIFLIFKVAEDAFGRVEVFGIEAFFIDAVEAVDLDLTGIDLPAEGIYDLPVFVVIEAGGAGREEKNGIAGMAKNEEFHVPPEAWTEPFMIFPVHGLMVDRYCRMIPFHNA